MFGLGWDRVAILVRGGVGTSVVLDEEEEWTGEGGGKFVEDKGEFMGVVGTEFVGV